jgi:hypothetical protein
METLSLFPVQGSGAGQEPWAWQRLGVQHHQSIPTYLSISAVPDPKLIDITLFISKAIKSEPLHLPSQLSLPS